MPEQLTNYQCPNCNGPLRFDPVSSKLKCDSCGSTFTVDEIDKVFFEKNQEAISVDAEKKQQENAELLQWNEEEAKNMRAYNCPSCGAQLISDANTAATRCPYCGNPTVVPAQFEGSLKPDYVIPFKLIKEDAVKELKNFYKGKPFLPKAFTESNHIEEIKGVYVPFWLFDADADGEVRYNATKVRMWSDSEYDYTETKYYRLYRKGHVRFENIPVDGSSKMPDDMMESIEPYDLKDAVDFQTAYLAGFLADKYDVDADSSIERANTRVKKSTEDAFMTNCGKYDTVTCEDSAVQIQNGTAKYALYPVWILNTKWKGENYSFAMNGQTGKFVGNLPENKSLVYLYYVVITLLGSVLAYIVILIMSWGK